MSLRSMTGQGRGTASANGFQVDVSITTLNRKHCDTQINLPKGYGQFELAVGEQIRSQIERGRVQVDVVIKGLDTSTSGVSIDMKLAGDLVHQLQSAAKALQLPGELSLDLLLNYPEIVRIEVSDEQREQIWPALSQALKLALNEVTAMREREGATLAKDMLTRVNALDKSIRQIDSARADVKQRHRESLTKRLEDADLPLDVNDDRLLREVAMFAERSDISEEITRLTSHIEQARDLLQQKDANGSRINFLCQELLREINTIGSKGAKTEITRAVIDFKVELEKLREQVQNIE